IVIGVLVIGGGNSKSGPVATINCIGGSEKKKLMADHQGTKNLHDRYRLRVDFTPLGSYDQVQLTGRELKDKGGDCLWPSSASAQNVFEETHATNTDFAAYRAETVLQSPEVIYAGPEGTKALIAEKVVEERDGRYYVVNMRKLLFDVVLQHRSWAALGARTIAGPVNISSTDP